MLDLTKPIQTASSLGQLASMHIYKEEPRNLKLPRKETFWQSFFHITSTALSDLLRDHNCAAFSDLFGLQKSTLTMRWPLAWSTMYGHTSAILPGMDTSSNCILTCIHQLDHDIRVASSELQVGIPPAPKICQDRGHMAKQPSLRPPDSGYEPIIRMLQNTLLSPTSNDPLFPMISRTIPAFGKPDSGHMQQGGSHLQWGHKSAHGQRCSQ